MSAINLIKTAIASLKFHKLRTLHLVYLQDTDEDILFHTQQCKADPHLWLDVMFQKRYTRCHVG